MTDDNAALVAEILGDWDWAGARKTEIIEVEDKYFYVIALDPGGTTGVACIRIDTEDTKAKPELVFLHQIPGGRHGFKEFFENSIIGDNAVLVSELWVERNVKGADREPQYIEGGMHWAWGEENIVWQEPEMKKLVSDDWLIEQNLWTPGKRHQMDALIHAIVYLRNDGHEGTQSALGNPEDGDTIGQPGEAEAAQLGEDAADMADALADLAEMAREIREDLEKRNGPGNQHGYGVDTLTPKGKRKERDVGGAFAGFNSAELDAADDGEGVLFDD